MSDTSEKPFLDWSSAEVDKTYRRIIEEQDTADLKVVWLGNHTLEPIVRATTAFADSYDVRIENLIGSYDQYFQPLLEDESEYLKGNPDVIILWLSLRTLARDLVEGGAGLSTAEIGNEIDRVFESIRNWVSLAEEKTNSHLIVCNFIRPAAMRFGVADTSCAAGEQAIYDDLNLRLSRMCQEHPRMTVADLNQAVSVVGSESAWNPRMYRLAKVEWDGPALRSIATLLARSLRALDRPARKCVVVDLDNTLWGGILGEDGPTGIRIGEGDPTGEAFSAFQRALKDLMARGILLAACSKNNRSDVEELFRLRQDMPLKLADFSASRINWENKHANIAAIARELNIGTDSLVFLDDNPVECELVRQMLPEVKTIHLPADPAVYADLVIGLPDFDKIRLTDEDRQKTAQYAANSARESRKSSATDLTRYLESLGTKLRIRPATESDLTRVHQLFAKTNQFNVTTIRYSVSDIEAFIGSEDHLLNISSVTDNFGDLGIIGVYLLRLSGEQAEIDSFLLSCRALGRGIETAICNQLKQSAFQTRGISALSARFVPTAKNMPSAGFFEKQGFECKAQSRDGESHFRLSRENFEDLLAPGIQVILEEEVE